MNYQLSRKLLNLIFFYYTSHEQPNELMPLFSVITRRNVYIQIFFFYFQRYQHLVVPKQTTT